MKGISAAWENIPGPGLITLLASKRANLNVGLINEEM